MKSKSNMKHIAVVKDETNPTETKHTEEVKESTTEFHDMQKRVTAAETKLKLAISALDEIKQEVGTSTVSWHVAERTLTELRKHDELILGWQNDPDATQRPKSKSA